jgi:deazaflavin-dependent oxidoreductase (nitroreductase family)
VHTIAGRINADVQVPPRTTPTYQPVPVATSMNRFTHRKDRHDIPEATSLHPAPGQSAGNADERPWLATLTVVGRRTGEPRKVPVIPVEVGQSRYLVSPYGESDCVRNLRTAGQGELSSKGQTEVFHASEVPVDEREDIIAKYREVAGSHIGPYFTKLPDPKDHPVFRVG